MEFTHPDNCNCYECIGPKHQYEVTGRTCRTVITNNVKHHTFGEACEDCGRPKSEYRDLGRKGYYTCWWCNKRAAGPEEL